ncbi:MAG TPA: hypothetical protein VGL69_03010 [Solirubrobacteraceae bacterium]
MQLRDFKTPRRLALMLLVGVAAALACAAPASASVAPCTDTWTGIAGDGLWSDAGNWSNGTPQSTDVACIGQGTSAELDAATTNFTVAGLELDGATITTDGSESLTVTGELDLQNATPASPGTPDVLGSGLTVAVQGTTNVDPDLDVCLATGDTLANSGTVTLGDGADLGGETQADCMGSSGGGVANSGTIVSEATTTQATIDHLTSKTGSILDGPGTLDVGSSLSLTAGVSGQIDLANDLTLEDDATTTLGANVDVCEDPSATVTIGSPATLTLGQDSDLGASDSGACERGLGGGQITNEGTIIAPGSATVAPAYFDNGGAVEATGSGGTLGIVASSSAGTADTGTYAIAQGATLEFDPTNRTIDEGTAFSGGGTLVLNSGTTDFESDANLSTLNRVVVSDGATAEVDETLQGPAGGTTPTMTVSGDLDGIGFATIPAGTATTFNGPDAQLGEDIDLVNDGAMTIAGSAKACIDEGATLENAGSLSLGSNANLGRSAANTNCDPSGTLLNDQGATMTSTGTTTVQTATFDNAGTVTVGNGSTLVIAASSQTTDTGGYVVPSGTTLSVQGTDVSRVLEGTISGLGKLSVTGPSTSLEIMPDASGSIGSLNVGSGATLQLDAGQSTPESGSAPALAVTGNATFAGTVAFDGDALTPPSSTETLGLLSFGSRTPGTPPFPKDDNGWAASFGTVGGGSGIVATITPEPPQNQTLPTISGTAAAGGTLTVTEGTWSGSPTQLSEQWEDCDPYGDPCTVVGNGSSYSPTQSDVGNQIEVVETASNAGGSNTATSATTNAVTTLAPVNLSPPEIDGDQGNVGEVLTDIPGEWQNNPSIAVQWEDCDITGTVCTPIPGATRASYTTTENDVNDSIVVVETATNAYGTAQAASDPSTPLIDLGDDGLGDDPTDGAGDGSGGRSSGTATVSVPVHTVSGTDLSIVLRCPERSSCPVTLTLTATEPTTASHAHATARGHRPSVHVVVVGSQTVRIAAGDRRTVTVSLNRAGTRLLASAHTLRTVLTASSSHATLERTSVTFTAAATASSKGSKPSSSGSTHQKPSRKHRPSTGHPAKRKARGSSHAHH